MAAEILIVDDEKDISDLLAYNLEKEGFAIQKAYDGEQALAYLHSRRPALILLDLMLPGIQGLEVCRRIRRQPETAAIPTIMLTAKGEESDKVLGLEMGADDYITKPFSVKELLARIRAVLRRTAVTEERPEKAEVFRHKGLHVDFQSYGVTIDGEEIELSPMEFKLLKFFCRNPGRVYSREQILDEVWGSDAFVEPRTVDVHIRRLRSQIEKNPVKPRYIHTVRGVGYKFVAIETGDRS
ncbi:MAG TPA: winged helix-turn-helix domain-containing protein [Syntrophales bacterium]|nr:winged helix-turn-helix domain-containing protein [Syntrophales bacterium]